MQFQFSILVWWLRLWISSRQCRLLKGTELWDNRQVISYQEAAADFHFAYDVRFFESFAHWFGLEYRKESRSKNFLLRPTNYHKIKLV